MSGLTVFLLALQLLGLPLQIIGLYLCSKRFMRDYFAAKALSGLINYSPDKEEHESIAELCYQLADAMIKAREA